LRRTISTISLLVFVALLAGCQRPAEQKQFLTVDFQQGQTLRYKFVSNKDIELNWDPSKDPKTANMITKAAERLEMVIAYRPVKIEPLGLTTIEARCESVKVRRSKLKKKGLYDTKDAVQSLAGKTFTLKVDPSGRIEDYSQLEELIKQAGEKAFRPKSKFGKVKEPDMIGDFVATQWFLWDAVSSLKEPAAGLEVGQTWNSQLPVPNPLLIRRARNVTYTLEQIRQTETGRIAVIKSTYSPAESIERWWPSPWSGKFKVSGMFGFLSSMVKGYDVLELTGQGRELYNIDAGRPERYDQEYVVKFAAKTPSPFGSRPQVTIHQKLTMRLVSSGKAGTGR